MGVFRENQRLPVAALLLCLVAGFAVSPPEYHRTHSGSRTRASRTLRLDDHDLDHAPGTALSGDHSGIHTDQAVLPGVSVVVAPPGPPGIVEIASAILPASVSCPIRPGRAPPSV